MSAGCLSDGWLTSRLADRTTNGQLCGDNKLDVYKDATPRWTLLIDDDDKRWWVPIIPTDDVRWCPYSHLRNDVAVDCSTSWCLRHMILLLIIPHRDVSNPPLYWLGFRLGPPPSNSSTVLCCSSAQNREREPSLFRQATAASVLSLYSWDKMQNETGTRAVTRH